jgi:hypothetical protein
MELKKAVRLVGLAALLPLLVAGSSTMAGPGTGGDGGTAKIQLAGTVTSQISYQGRLADAHGNPMNGTVNMVFQLWNAASGGQLMGAGDIVKNNVGVTNGLFTVQLDVPHDAFNGQGLWLQIRVNGQTLSPRQALLPVPYALSLRPGAIITSPGPDTLHVGNEAGGWAVEAWSRNNIALLGTNGPGGGSPPSGMHGVHGIGAGIGVYGQGGHTGVYGNGTSFGVKGDSSGGDGVTGETTAANKAGVYGHNRDGAAIRGRSENSDAIVGWTGAASKSGISGLSDAGVGVTGRSSGNDGVVGVTSSTLPGNAGVRARNEGSGPAIFSEGDLYVTGALRGNVGARSTASPASARRATPGTGKEPGG